MKTPREILLNRHQAAEPKLDRLRREVIDQEVRGARVADQDLPSIVQSPGDWLAVLWQQALRPWRPAWLGLAAAWLVILGLHLAGNGDGRAVQTSRRPPAAATAAEFREQLRLRAELLEAAPSVDARPAPIQVGPRSDETWQGRRAWSADCPACSRYFDRLMTLCKTLWPGPQSFARGFMVPICAQHSRSRLPMDIV